MENQPYIEKIRVKIAKGGRKKSKKAVQQKKVHAKEKIIRQNLIKDKFAVTVPNKLWSSDISEFLTVTARSRSGSTKLNLLGLQMKACFPAP